MDFLARTAAALGRFSQRWVPSAFSIAVLLTIGTAALAAVTTDATSTKILQAWGSGFWSLLAFAMRMAIVMFAGYMLAVAPSVSRALAALARLPRTPRQAVFFMAMASMVLALVNWGLSIVGSAVLVKFLAQRSYRNGARVDYRLLVACAYFGLGTTWHAGLSASAPLIASTASEPITQQFGVVGIAESILSPFNLGLIGATLALMGALAMALHPTPEATISIEPARLEALKEFSPPRKPEQGGFAAWLDHAPWLGIVLGICALTFVGWRIIDLGWKKIDLDLVNLTFFGLAVLAHRTPASALAAAEQASGVLSGIVFQFPLYAGIYGIFAGTGLTQIIGDFIVRHASASTFPAVIYWYSGIINYFVPSGGAKWTIEAPYILQAAQSMQVSPAKMVLAYAWGDMATDLIQPFWALPLLAVAKLDFKDILGYLLLACAAYIALVSAAFLLFM